MNGAATRGPSALPLFMQTLGLVFVTLFAALTAVVVVILSLPPPAPQIHGVPEVVQAIRGAGAAPGAGSEHALSVHFSSHPPVPTTQGLRRILFRDALAKSLARDPSSVVVAQLGPRLLFFNSSQGNQVQVSDTPSGTEPILMGAFQVAIRVGVGRWIIVTPKPTLGFNPWQQRVLLVIVLAALAVSPIAWAFARQIAAPIKAFAAGAERLGRDPQAPPLNISGSTEITAAVQAFNQMQTRLRRYVEDRTSMMGAIAHDLRTPLTRLRFRIEAVPEPLREKLAADLDQMEAMVASTMGFVRDAAQSRDRRKLEIASLVETVMDEAALTGANAAVESADRVIVDGDPLALKRLVANLVDNALKFGASARARVHSEGEMAVIQIDDDGPGMPEAEAERVFEPFHRLEISRNRGTGGIGLGLAVVRAVARGHGGDVVLRNRSEGGLSAIVTLPLATVADNPRPARAERTARAANASPQGSELPAEQA